MVDENAARVSKELVVGCVQEAITIEFRDTPLKTVFEVISRTSGLNFVFDKDVRVDQKTTDFLRNSSIEAAINVLLMTNRSPSIQRVMDGNSMPDLPSVPANKRSIRRWS